jgi:hypothetical protein
VVAVVVVEAKADSSVASNVGAVAVVAARAVAAATACASVLHVMDVTDH